MEPRIFLLVYPCDLHSAWSSLGSIALLLGAEGGAEGISGSILLAAMKDEGSLEV